MGNESGEWIMHGMKWDKWYTNENIDQMLMETRESVQKMMMYALHSPLKNLY